MVCCQVPVQNQRGSLKVSLTVRHRHVHMQVCIKLVDAVVAQADTTAQISSHAFCFKITGFVFSRVVFGPRIAKKFQKHIGTAPTAIPFFLRHFVKHPSNASCATYPSGRTHLISIIPRGPQTEDVPLDIDKLNGRHKRS